MLDKLIQRNTPFIDVRSPKEFDRGSMPNSVNIPILNDVEREIIGKIFKQDGSDAAQQAGYDLVKGNLKNERVVKWKNFIDQNPNTWLYCARGGLRSRIAQSWLKDIGVDVDIVKSGFKSLRNFCLKIIDDTSKDKKHWIILAGRTGSNKTKLINKLNNSIDLEKLANHRGSAFGKRSTPQPTPINFENMLSVKYFQHNNKKLILEDESRTIGRLVIPDLFYNKMRQSNICILEVPFTERVENIYNDYIGNLNFSDNQVLLNMKKFQNNLIKISKRLGSDNFKKIDRLMKSAFKDAKKETHFQWIGELLSCYYDRMYDYQLNKKMDKCIHKGNWDSCLDFLE